VTKSRYLLHRLAYLLPTVLAITILVFFMIHLIPGNPASAMLGPRATPARVAALDRLWGLNRPLLSQYWLFMDRLVHGNLGTSLFLHVSVTSLITERIGPTLLLLTGGTVFTIVLTMPLAAVAATHKGRLIDQLVRVVPLIGLSMPAFWMGIILLLLFALKIPIFPVAGFGVGIGGHLVSIVLPALTVAFAIAPLTIRSLRTAMLEALTSEYVVTARAKRISEARVVVRHGLRNALPPAVSVLGVNIGWLVGGTVVVEQVFSLPGLGSLMLSSIYNKDFPVVQGVTLVFAGLVVLVNLGTDVLFALLDPRVTFE
jgi:peptide/nickel transport system permease protein